jgi:F-type H+-transporting ATPase subunit delta
MNLIKFKQKQKNLITNWTKALFFLSQEKKAEKEYYQITKTLLFILNEVPEVIPFLLKKKISFLEKKKLIKDWFSFSFLKKENKELFFNFLFLLIENNLFSFLKDILFFYQNLYYKREDVIQGTVFSVEKLNQRLIDKLILIFQKKFKKEVILINKIDQKLLKGIKIKINQLIFDYSFLNYLEKFHRYLNFS